MYNYSDTFVYNYSDAGSFVDSAEVWVCYSEYTTVCYSMLVYVIVYILFSHVSSTHLRNFPSELLLLPAYGTCRSLLYTRHLEPNIYF